LPIGQVYLEANAARQRDEELLFSSFYDQKLVLRDQEDILDDPDRLLLRGQHGTADELELVKGVLLQGLQALFRDKNLEATQFRGFVQRINSLQFEEMGVFIEFQRFDFELFNRSLFLNKDP
jgi:hypothetical protein